MTAAEGSRLAEEEGEGQCASPGDSAKEENVPLAESHELSVKHPQTTIPLPR